LDFLQIRKTSSRKDLQTPWSLEQVSQWKDFYERLALKEFKQLRKTWLFLQQKTSFHGRVLRQLVLDKTADYKKSWFEDFHLFNERLDDVMKDLFFLQRKTWFQFRKTCKKIGLKTSISSTKDFMMWWKTYFIFNERLDFNSKRLDFNSKRLVKILFWRLPYLQWKTWWFDERLTFSSTKDLIPIQKDLIPIQKDLQKAWFEDFYFFNKRLDDVMKDLQNFGLKTSYLQRKTWWCHERLIYFFNKRFNDVMKDLFFL